MVSRRLTRTNAVLISALLVSILSLAACLPGGPADASGNPTITVYGFSIMKEALDKQIIPAFKEKWKREHGQDIEFFTSFAGSETIVNQILYGAPADVAMLSIERDAQRLFDGKATRTDWHAYPNRGIVNKTPFVILVRKGNPKGIEDFSDLAKPGVELIHPDPVSSGGAQWSILAIYGSQLRKSQDETGTPDNVQAVNTLKAIWKNVISSPGSAREARTQFELGQGDALVTYELDALLQKQKNLPVEIVVPKITIFSEHPAVIVDRNVTDGRRPAVEAFMEYLWTDEAQKAFVKYHFRSVTNEAFNSENTEFATIQEPFGVEMLGGWSRAYPEVIEGIFRDQVQAETR